MKKISILPLSAALFLSVNINAADQQEVYQQETMVVTASRYEQSKDDVIPSVTVIDRDEIIKLQANNVLDLLSLQQGIDVARTGGNGSSTSVFMRGTNSNHTLILIDGMRVGSSFSGSFSWEHLPVSQIERIEIVRGTRVSYYGADAIGGVINIITRKQEKLYARYTGGSFNTQNFDIGYGNSYDKGHYSLILGRQKTDGFSSTNDRNDFAYNPDDDAYENQSINFSGSVILKSSKLSLNYMESSADIDFDSYYNVGFSETKERIAKLTWSASILNDWQSELSLGSNFNSIETKAFSNDFNSDRLTFDWLLNKSFDKHSYGIGLTYRDEESSFKHHILNNFSYDSTRKNSAIFGNWQGIFEKNIFSISARYDHNNIYGNDTSADISWAYQFNDGTRFNLAAGSAFRAPDLNALNSPLHSVLVFSPQLGTFVNFFSFEGNPDLKPEESINYEMGLKTKLANNHDLSFNLFYYQIDNLIDYQGATFKPVNVFESTIKGLEANYDYKLDSFTLNVNATVQDTNNDETDEPLLRRPDNKLNISVDKYFNKFSLGSSLRYASTSQDFDAELDSYTVFDLRASYKLSDHWRLALKLENVTDEDYQLVNGYNTPKASGYLTIEWQQ